MVFVEHRDTNGQVLLQDLLKHKVVVCILSFSFCHCSDGFVQHEDTVLLNINFNEMLGAKLNYYQQAI